MEQYKLWVKTLTHEFPHWERRAEGSMGDCFRIAYLMWDIERRTRLNNAAMPEAREHIYVRFCELLASIDSGLVNGSEKYQMQILPEGSAPNV